ncbi:V4R domain-containing protein [uncultured Methanospirillum sp.]|uniref:V4R domain-containing protein n=1 Tax=uncultured Methanospirillum sp. TaxID=262503 RepID=UPI0029C842BD|nr:V4R domain-containing protein [uncultured Methanospirillum sp.]
MDQRDKFTFTWDLIGDPTEGRPNLGPLVPLEVYRLMQYCLREVIEDKLGVKQGESVIYEAGKKAGVSFYHHVLPPTTDHQEFIRALQDTLKELKVGIFRIEQGDLDGNLITASVSEDLDCSGLPELGYGVCTYDEGFLAGIFEQYTGKKCQVREIDCWCTGERTCRFSIELHS